MGCCRSILEKVNSESRGVICLNLVIPVRIIAFALLGGNWVYIMLHLDSIDVITIFITMLTLLLSVTMLKECSRSVVFHRELDRLEGKEHRD